MEINIGEKYEGKGICQAVIVNSLQRPPKIKLYQKDANFLMIISTCVTDQRRMRELKKEADMHYIEWLITPMH